MKNTKWIPPTCFDMHSDIPIDVTRSRLRGEKNILVNKHYPRLKEGGISGTVLIVGGDEVYPGIFGNKCPLRNTMITLDDILTEVEQYRERFIIVTEAMGLKAAREENKLAIVLGIEGAKPIGKDLSVLRNLYRLGVRLIGLTWNERNEVASGVGEGKRAGGLSQFGEKFVKEMNKLGMIIDVSHLSPDGVNDVLAISKDPVLASHTNSYNMCKHPRNLADSQIRKIAEKGGVVGVVGYPAFVGNNPTIELVVEHISHLINVAGEDNVGIGLDFIDYAIDIFKSNLSVSSVDYGEDFDYPKGLENVTKVKHLLYCLHKKGFSDDLIDKIAWRNFESLFTSIVCK